MLPTDMLSLTRLCLPPPTYFQFGSVFYEQVEGTVMSSPVVANIYMQDFKHRALTTVPLKPSRWLCYVDDTFVMWKHGYRELQGFLGHLNAQCAEIQFTMEKETKGSIPFLNVHVKDGSKLATSVYRKPTHTDCYLHYSSHHHPNVKSGVVFCLQHRAEGICKQDSALADERKHVQNVLMTNGYPK